MISFAKWCKKYLPENFWTEHLSFFLDWTGFAHKSNLCEQARATKGRTWRKISEGLTLGCTSKGTKRGNCRQSVKTHGGHQLGKGVIICEPYEKMTVAYFSNFIHRNFNTMFQTADKWSSPIWVQDGDPSQNSALAKLLCFRLIRLCCSCHHKAQTCIPQIICFILHPTNWKSRLYHKT